VYKEESEEHEGTAQSTQRPEAERAPRSSFLAGYTFGLRVRTRHGAHGTL
jgi:hypothetical protein